MNHIFFLKKNIFDRKKVLQIVLYRYYRIRIKMKMIRNTGAHNGEKGKQVKRDLTLEKCGNILGWLIKFQGE